MSLYNSWLERSRVLPNLKLSLKLICIFISLVSFRSYGFSGSTIGCRQKDTSIKQIQFTSQFMLNRTLMDRMLGLSVDQKRQDFFVQAAKFQIQHLVGLFRTTREDGLNAALGSFIGDIVITKVEESIPYGMNLSLDNYLLPKRDLSLSTNDYVRLAVESGRLTKQDAGVQVSYKTKLTIADCSEGDFEKKLKVVVPKDPFLSLWVESSKSRTLRNWGPQSAVIQKCSANEFVHFGTADQAWFFWSPLTPRRAETSSQKSEVCEPELGSTFVAEISNVQKVKESPSLDQEFFKEMEKFKFFSIFGEISDDERFAKVDFKKIKSEIEKISKGCVSTKLVSDCLTLWEPLLRFKSPQEQIEPGLYYFLIFLRDLNTIVDLDSFKLNEKVDGNQIQVAAEGRLRNSKKAISLNVFFGRTTLDWGPPATLQYSKFLNEAMKNANSLSYLGHSGLGMNLKMAEWQKLWTRDKLKPIQRTSPLWMGIYNCEGFSYFGNDLEALYRPGHLDVVLTLSTGVEAEAKFPLAQLSAIDFMGTGKKGKQVQELIGKFVHSKDFYTEIKLNGSVLP